MNAENVMCVCASIVHCVKRHNSINQGHIMQTMSDICDQLTALRLTLKPLSLNLTCLGNYCCVILVLHVPVITAVWFKFFLRTAEALARDCEAGWLVFVNTVSHNLQKAWFSNFACKEHVLGDDAYLFFFFNFWCFFPKNVKFGFLVNVIVVCVSSMWW